MGKPIIIRPYQEEGVDRLLQLRSVAKLGVGLESPTGTGKSLMAALLAKRLASEGRRVMILAHREELVVGNAGAVERLTGEKCYIELNTRHKMTYTDWKELKGNGGIVSASVDTVQGKRLKAMPQDLITDLIVDEAHHVRPLTSRNFGYECKPCQGEGFIEKADGKQERCEKCWGEGTLKETGSKYYKVKTHFQGCYWYGLSGTFYRAGKDADKTNVMGKVFDQVHTTGTLYDFVDNGWLVEPIFDHLAAVSVHLDFSKLKTKHVSEKQAQEVWNTHKLEALSALRQALAENCGDRVTLIFSPKVQHASWITEFIQNADTNIYPTMGPETADYVASYLLNDDGTRKSYPEDRRRGVIERMRASVLQWCANQGVFTEGTDIPSVAALAMCRQTESRNLMRQMVGRGLRTLPGVLDGLELESADVRRIAIAESKKPNCLVLDMSGVTMTGVADLATPTSVLQIPGWTKQQEDLAKRYWQVMWERGRTPGIREAKEEIEAASSAWMQGVRAMMQEARETVDWEKTRVDLRNGVATQVATVHREASPDRPTDKQVKFLARLARDTGVYDWTKEEIESFDRKTVSAKIAELKPIRDKMPTPSWLQKQLREAGKPNQMLWGDAYRVLHGDHH